MLLLMPALAHAHMHLQAAQVPLESVPLSNGAFAHTLTPTQPGLFRGVPIPHGLRLGASNAHIDVRPGLHYSSLSGIIYFDDTMLSSCDASEGVRLAIYNSTDSSHPYLIWHGKVAPKQQMPFTVATGGMIYLTLVKGGCFYSSLDVTGVFSTSAVAPHASTASVPPSQQPRSAAPTLQLSFPSVVPGGQQTAIVSTRPNAYVTFIVGYPVGKPRVVGPERADIAGHLTYTWGVPGTVHGTVRVFAVTSTGVAQATFIVGP